MITLPEFSSEIRKQIYPFLDNRSLVRLSLASRTFFFTDLTNDGFFKEKFLKDNPFYKDIHEKIFDEVLYLHSTFFWKAACIKDFLSFKFFVMPFDACMKNLKAQHEMVQEEIKKFRASDAKEIYEQCNSDFQALIEKYGNPETAIEENGSGFIKQIKGLIDQGKKDGISEEETLIALKDPRLIPWPQYLKMLDSKSVYNDLEKRETEWKTLDSYLENAFKELETSDDFADFYKEFFLNIFENGADFEKIQKDLIPKLKELEEVVSKEEEIISDASFDKIKILVENLNDEIKTIFFMFLDNSYRDTLKKEMVSASLLLLSDVIEKIEAEVECQLDNQSFFSYVIQDQTEITEAQSADELEEDFSENMSLANLNQL